MAVTYFPFDAGSGSAITEASWQKMARRWLNTGVITGYLNQLQVTADGTGMTVSVNTGAAWIEGFYGENDAAAAQTITAAHATLSRIDRVVLRLDRTANTVALAVLAGTAAASPVAPTLTTTDTLWEISLATVLVDPAVGVIAAGKVTDTRTLVKNLTEAAASAAYAPIGSSDVVKIAQTTLAASATSVVFSSIAGTYRALRLLVTVRTIEAANQTLLLRMNADTASNYEYQLLRGNAGTASASNTATDTAIRIGQVLGGGTTTQFAHHAVDLMDYASTARQKQILARMANSGNTEQTGGLWRSTAAVTSLTLSAGFDVAFEVGSVFSLYGVK